MKWKTTNAPTRGNVRSSARSAGLRSVNEVTFRATKRLHIWRKKTTGVLSVPRLSNEEDSWFIIRWASTRENDPIDVTFADIDAGQAVLWRFTFESTLENVPMGVLFVNTNQTLALHSRLMSESTRERNLIAANSVLIVHPILLPFEIIVGTTSLRLPSKIFYGKH